MIEMRYILKDLNINDVKLIKLTKMEFDNVEQKIGKYFSDIDEATKKNAKGKKVQKNIILNISTRLNGRRGSRNPEEFINDAELLIDFQADEGGKIITSVSIDYQIILEVQEKIDHLTDKQKKELSDFAMLNLEPYFREAVDNLSYKTQLALPKLPLRFWKKGKN